MYQISPVDIEARLARDNPWWANSGPSAFVESNLPKRVYFEPFKQLALNFNVKRAAVLLGPRRVGKTVLLKQIVQEAVAEGLDRSDVLYVSIDTPLYTNLSLQYFVDKLSASAEDRRCLVVFDEIQYLKDWQIHLKDLVDSYPKVKFIASGSAAAALSLQSKESGAGRFSDFMLPPLTFSEYLDFSGRSDLVESDDDGYRCAHVDELNKHFIDYLNFGGYPEAVVNQAVRDNPEQFIRIDIIEKVLLKDLPSLYGIKDIQELNKLFMVLAYNAGNETSYENISQSSGITKATIKNYIEYLESAFLILKVNTVNDNCKAMERERNFKVYLNNPSMRAALFNPVKAEDSTLIGHLAESAVFSQWQHAPAFKQLRYARWRNSGEVDIVCLEPGNQKPAWAGEIKWSDRLAGSYSKETKHLRYLLEKHSGMLSAFFTTKSLSGKNVIAGRSVTIWPTALYCYVVGRNTTSDLSLSMRYGFDSKIIGDDNDSEEEQEVA